MVLEMLIRPKRMFNENSKKDMALAKQYFQTLSWGKGGCPFILEFPYLTIPHMIQDKIVHRVFGMKFDRRHHWDKLK